MVPARLLHIIFIFLAAFQLGVVEVETFDNGTESALDDVTMDEEAPCSDGQQLIHGCDEICNCKNGRMECKPRCAWPLVKSAIGNHDGNCSLQSKDECCSVLVCSQQNEEPVMGKCVYNNNSYKIGETFEIGCTSICECTKTKEVICKPRCPPTNKTNSDLERCLTAPDKKNPCCMILYCDVNDSDDSGLDEENEEDFELNLISAVPANNSAVILNFDSPFVPDQIHAEMSENNNSSWLPVKATGHTVNGLTPGKTYYFRVRGHSGVSNVVSSTLPLISVNSSVCEYKGKTYQKGVEFHDGCTAYCMCAEEGVECATFKCPTYFGLDVLDPQCLKWEPRPVDFKPEPPHCCPESVVCVNNGSCVYEGELFENWADIPSKLSGCEVKCYCQAGNVTCSPRCPPVPATPPQDILCASSAVPILAHPLEDNCCLHWICPPMQGEDNYSTEKTANSPPPNVDPVTDPVVPFLGPFSPNFLLNKTMKTVYSKIKQHTVVVKNNIKNSPVNINKSSQLYDPNWKGSESKINFTEVLNANDGGKYNLINFNGTIFTNHSTSHNNSSEINRIKEPNIYGTKNNLGDEEWPKNHNSSHLKNQENNSYYNGIPIGIINPDKLSPENEGTNNNYSSTLLQHNANHNPVEQYFKYNQFQDTKNDLNNQKFKPTSTTQQQANIFQIPGAEFIEHNPQNNQFHYQQNIQYQPNQNIKARPFELKKDIPIDSNFHKFGYFPQQISQHNPHIIPVYHGQGDIHPSKTYFNTLQQNIPYVSPEELYLIGNKGDKLDSVTKNNQHLLHTTSTLTGNPTIHEHSRPIRLKLEDIIDDFKQQEGTDSHSSDLHVLLIPSHPQNFVQGVTQQPTAGFPNHPFQGKDDITVHTLEAVDENSVRLVFSVPRIFVGLYGRVELRYTADNKNSDPATWEQQVFAPPDDLIATPELEFKLEDLQPDTEYKIKITVVMKDLQNSPASQILTVKTLPATKSIPSVIPVEPELTAVNVNSTSATISWRKFTDKELQFIDGVQLRYKEIEGKVYQTTPLIHRVVISYTLKDLKPESQYEVGLLLIPFPGQKTELLASKTIQLTTSAEDDPYKFELMLDVHHIKSTSVEVTWTGVPYPVDKYVNIFRAIYQSEGGREDMNVFKVAKRDSPAGTLIQGLKPDTRYRLWIEAYLTNGKIMKSNVKDFIMKKGSGSSLNPNQGKLEGASLAEANDYYGPLVGVSILAAIAILVAGGLLVVLAKKHGHNKAPITTAVQRKSLPHTAAYDNPSYKVDMQHETMDL